MMCNFQNINPWRFACWRIEQIIQGKNRNRLWSGQNRLLFDKRGLLKASVKLWKCAIVQYIKKHGNNKCMCVRWVFPPFSISTQHTQNVLFPWVFSYCYAEVKKCIEAWSMNQNIPTVAIRKKLLYVDTHSTTKWTCGYMAKSNKQSTVGALKVVSCLFATCLSTASSNLRKRLK